VDLKTKLAYFCGLATLGFGLWVASASADVIFTLGNNPQPDENNILFAAGDTGIEITGEVDHSGVAVDFTSLTGQTLFQNAQGQASISEVNGNPLTSMKVDVPGYTFGDFILNLQNGTGTATVTAVDNFSEVFHYDLGNGQNYLTITTANGESIASLSVMMSSGGGFDVFKQPRISQVCNAGTCVPDPPAPIPEPQTLALLGFGLVSLMLVRRRRVA
jgi:PEP-CTERM motif